MVSCTLHGHIHLHTRGKHSIYLTRGGWIHKASHFLLCLYESRKVNGHVYVYVCKGLGGSFGPCFYDLFLFIDFATACSCSFIFLSYFFLLLIIYIRIIICQVNFVCKKLLYMICKQPHLKNMQFSIKF